MNNYLYGRYVTDGVDVTGNFDSKGYIDFLLQNLGFVINLKKSILQLVKQLKFLGLQTNTEEMKHLSQKGH